MIDWSVWQGASCLPSCWCEAPRIGVSILEPVNTWTNLVFIFAGFIFLLKPAFFLSSRNKLSSWPVFPRLYGFALAAVGLGSFFFHASETFVGQWFDVFGMYLVSIFFIAYNFYRVGRLNQRTFLLFYFGVCSLLGVIIFYFPEPRRWLFGVSIVIVAAQSVWVQMKAKSRIQKNYLYGSVASYAFAQVVWYLDETKIWCNPYAWMNGHGLWHIFTGLAAILIYLYFGSEELEGKNSLR